LQVISSNYCMQLTEICLKLKLWELSMKNQLSYLFLYIGKLDIFSTISIEFATF